jgi:small-conductance mechanosensitive channel
MTATDTYIAALEENLAASERRIEMLQQGMEQTQAELTQQILQLSAERRELYEMYHNQLVANVNLVNQNLELMDKIQNLKSETMVNLA